MSNEDLRKTLDAMKSVQEEATASPEAARKLLVRLGMITETGELTPEYRQNSKPASSVA
jgi:hypothetical protein